MKKIYALGAIILFACCLLNTPIQTVYADDQNDVIDTATTSVTQDAASNTLDIQGQEAIAFTNGEKSITQSAENNGVHVRKTLLDNEDGTYQLELESWATGDTRIERIPMDVVLVMDTSGSMRLPCSGAANRLEALKTAACAFVDTIQEQNNGIELSEQSRIALVQYSSADNTGIRKHLTCVDSAGASSLKTTIKSFTKGGRTRMDLGMELAEEIMNTEANTNRNRAVVLFTDGVPANEEYDGFVMVTANRTLAAAKRIKENGIEVFGLSIEQYAKCNPGEAMPTYAPHGAANYIAPYYGIGGENTSNENAIALENRLMYLITSDNPHAQDMDTPNTEDPSDPGQTKGEKRETYYFTAQTATELSTVFRNLATEVGTSDTSLGTNAQARDDIPWPFRRTENTIVHAYEADYLGDGKWSDRKEITSQLSIQDINGSVKVQGFNYSGNYVSEDPHPEVADGIASFRGRKLILSFSISLEAMFGGNQIATNGEASGIYADGTTEKAEVLYPVPRPDLRPRYEIEVTDICIYVPDPIDLERLVIFPDDFRPDGKKNAYINIHYEMINEEGSVIGTLDIPATEKLENCNWKWTNKANNQCQQYVVNCTVTPIRTGHFEQKRLTAKGTVHVFRPRILFQDTTQEIGELSDTIPGDSTKEGNLGKHLKQIQWTCTDEITSNPEDEPELGFYITITNGIQQENGKWTINSHNDIPVIVEVHRIKDGKLDENITKDTHFQHECKQTTCMYENISQQKNETRYLIHTLESQMKDIIILPNTGGVGRGGIYGTACIIGIASTLIYTKKRRRRL